ANMPVAAVKVALKSAADATVQKASTENTQVTASENQASGSTSPVITPAVQAGAKPEDVEGIDPVTARIMARRGVQITAALQVKKSERQQAPTDAAEVSEVAGTQETVT